MKGYQLNIISINSFAISTQYKIFRNCNLIKISCYNILKQNKMFMSAYQMMVKSHIALEILSESQTKSHESHCHILCCFFCKTQIMNHLNKLQVSLLLVYCFQTSGILTIIDSQEIICKYTN